MHLKKIYIEITNGCNLNCDFCIKNQIKVINMCRKNYEFIIDKIKNYTDEIYLHVLGEPLMHKDINEFIDYAHDNNLLVNITTNGYLIKNIKNNQHLHRLNISLHSYHPRYKTNLNTYLHNIFEVIENIRDKTFVTLRLWVNNQYNKDILSYINMRYNTNILKVEENSKIKITNNLIIDTFHPFIWPDLNNGYYSEEGTCKGLINHLGILVDGTIIPCCLDTKGIINLGNIYEDELDTIFNKQIVKDMIKGFKDNHKYHELCKHCRFIINKEGNNNENIKLERKD